MTYLGSAQYLGVYPTTSVTPFTYREGATMMHIMEKFKDWAIGLGPEVQAILDESLATYSERFAALEANIAATKAQWQALFDQFMVDIVSNLEGLNDQAVANLIRQAASNTRVALTEVTYVRAPNTTMYVSPTGNDTNDGLSAATPKRLINTVLRMTETVAQDTDSMFTIILAHGTYAERVRGAAFTPYNLNITIKGPDVGGHPQVPYAIISEASSGAAATGIVNTNPNMTLTVRDVKFIGYNGTTSASGINNTFGRIFTHNVHVDNCYWGLSSIRGNLDIKGGILSNCGTLGGDDTGNGGGVRSLMQNRHAIGRQNAGTQNEGPFIRNCVSGVFAQELSTGHVDWCIIEDCSWGVNLSVQARANCDGTKFARNQSDVRCGTNSSAYVTSNNIYGTGVNKSLNNFWPIAGGNIQFAPVGGRSNSYGQVRSTVHAQYSPKEATGTNDSVDLYSTTIKAPYFAGRSPISQTAQKKLTVRAVGRVSGTGGYKEMILHFGGRTCFVTFTADQTGAFIWESDITFVGENTQVLTTNVQMNFQPNRVAVVDGVIDMTTDTALIMRTKLGHSYDSVVVDYVEVNL